MGGDDPDSIGDSQLPPTPANTDADSTPPTKKGETNETSDSDRATNGRPTPFVSITTANAEWRRELHHPDVITLLVSQQGYRPMAKKWALDPSGMHKKVSTKLPWSFKHNTIRMVGMTPQLLLNALKAIQARSDYCIIRGAIRADRFESAVVRRTIHGKPGDPRAPDESWRREGTSAFFESAQFGRRWICLDVDNLHCPSAVDAAADPIAAANHAISRLPSPFRGAACAYQFSGSMGLGADPWGKIKVHLWFVLKDPVTDSKLKDWCDRDPSANYIDKALFSPIQIHFTAAPIIDPRIVDPFGPTSGRNRCGIIAGKSEMVDLLPYITDLDGTKSRATTKRRTIPPTPVPIAPDTRDSLSANPDNSVSPLSQATNEFLRGGAAEGERNSKCFAAACDLAGNGIPREDALKRLLDAAANCSPPMDSHEIEQVVDSAYSQTRSPTVTCPNLDADAEPLSELWFARLIATEHGHKLRYVEHWNRWLIWSDAEGCWHEDQTGEVMRLAEDVATKILPTLVKQFIDSSDEGVEEGDGDGDAEADEKTQRAIKAVIKKFQSRNVLQHCVELLGVERIVASTVEVWNRRPWELCVANGTIELKTGEIRPSERSDHVTKRSPIEFDPNAACPVWEAFLEQVQPDPEIRGFLQRVIGYAATGAPVEHALFVLYGVGANGKTTFVEAIRNVLGGHAGTAPSKLLLIAKGERHPTELTTLFAKRFVVCSETPEGGRLDESLMKSLTGGDRITARGMRQDFWEFDPTHALFLLTNHKPRVVGTDEGVWRRLILVPFSVTIPPESRDRDLPEKLRAEAKGILAWIVRGAREYLERGLKPPEAVQVATKEYRSGEDLLGQYVDERLARIPGAFLSSKALYDDYGRWCDDLGLAENHRLSQRNLTSRLVDRGYVMRRTNAARGFLDIALREGEEASVAEPAKVSGSFRDASVTQSDASFFDASPRNSDVRREVATPGDAVTLPSLSQTSCARAHTRTCMKTNPDPASLRHDASRDNSKGGEGPGGDGSAATNERVDEARDGGATGATRPRPASPPERCPACGEARFARLLDPSNSPWVCQTCHPAPDPDSGRWEFAASPSSETPDPAEDDDIGGSP